MTQPPHGVPSRLLTLDEYLTFEASSTLRHKFVSGEVFAMTGASRRHNQVVWNLLSRLKRRPSSSPCEVYFEVVKLRLESDIYYPDIVITCSASDNDDKWVREPCLLIEVTSPTTARTDRTEKVVAYQKIASLRSYLVIEQAWRRVVRTGAGPVTIGRAKS